jgi:hypothetical protein
MKPLAGSVTRPSGRARRWEFSVSESGHAWRATRERERAEALAEAAAAADGPEAGARGRRLAEVEPELLERGRKRLGERHAASGGQFEQARERGSERGSRGEWYAGEVVECRWARCGRRDEPVAPRRRQRRRRRRRRRLGLSDVGPSLAPTLATRTTSLSSSHSKVARAPFARREGAQDGDVEKGRRRPHEHLPIGCADACHAVTGRRSRIASRTEDCRRRLRQPDPYPRRASPTREGGER